VINPLLVDDIVRMLTLVGRFHLVDKSVRQSSEVSRRRALLLTFAILLSQSLLVVLKNKLKLAAAITCILSSLAFLAMNGFGLAGTNPVQCFLNKIDLHAAVEGYYSNGNVDSVLRQNVVAQYGEIEDWCVDELTDFSNIFDGDQYTAGTVQTYLHTEFNADLSSWNTAKATDMTSMFYQATKFNANLSSWDVRQVTTMYQTFYGATVFVGEGLSGWNVGKVTTMSSMFGQTTMFNTNLSSWDVSQVATMDMMFYGATLFAGDGLSGWNMGKVTNMAGMFIEAIKFNANLASWDVSQVTGMTSMFYGTTVFVGDGLSRWNVGKVTSMTAMFLGAPKFNENLSSWDVSQVTVMLRMFNDALSFHQDLCVWGTKLRPTANLADMFGGRSGCDNKSDPEKNTAEDGWVGPFCSDTCAD
jgi:surface protein